MEWINLIWDYIVIVVIGIVSFLVVLTPVFCLLAVNTNNTITSSRYLVNCNFIFRLIILHPIEILSKIGNITTMKMKIKLRPIEIHTHGQSADAFLMLVKTPGDKKSNGPIDIRHAFTIQVSFELFTMKVFYNFLH